MLFYSSTNECNTGVPTSFAHENLKISQKEKKNPSKFIFILALMQVSLQFDEKIQNY